MFEFVDAEKAAYVAELCENLGVSRSGYYRWKKNPLSQRRRDDERLGAAIAPFTGAVGSDTAALVCTPSFALKGRTSAGSGWLR